MLRQILRGKNSVLSTKAPNNYKYRTSYTPNHTVIETELVKSVAMSSVLLLKIGFLRIWAAPWMCLGHRVCRLWLAVRSPHRTCAAKDGSRLKPPQKHWHHLLPLLSGRRLFLSVIFLRLGLLCTHNLNVHLHEVLIAEINDDFCRKL